MKTIIRNISLLLCVVAALASCKRKPIYDECVCSSTLSIPIDIDWATSGITLQNVTILFYDSEDGSLKYEHKYEQNDNEIQSYVSLPEGRYTAVIFNELRDQIDYLSCVDYENISTLKFESNSDDPFRARATTRSYVEQSGDLAVAVVEGIDVTQDMILEAATLSYNTTKSYTEPTRTTVESLMGVTTVKKNTTITITARFQNLYYARMPALVDLVNLADGYYVYGDKNSTTPSTLQFTMNNRTYNSGSYYDGYIWTTITTFGTLGERTSTSGHDSTTPVTLDVLFKLIDADWTETSDGEFKMDITDLIEHETNADGSVMMYIDVTYPNAITPVEPEGSSGDSGFGADVADWSTVYVPLTQ